MWRRGSSYGLGRAAWSVAAFFLARVVANGHPAYDHCRTEHEPEAWRSVVAAVVGNALARSSAATPPSSPPPADPPASVVEATSLGHLRREGHVYQVGVFTGNSMVTLQQALDPPMIWGFDSFEGLPASAEEHVSEWHQGKYRDDPRARLLDELGGASRHGWVGGFYEASLAASEDVQVAARGMAPAAYIDMDCDLYASAKNALDFFFRNELAVPGTLIGYDDWWVLPCGQGNAAAGVGPLSVGEGRAHAEAAEKWNVTFRCVAGPCFTPPPPPPPGAKGEEEHPCGRWLRESAWGVIFQVVSVGSDPGAAAGAAGAATAAGAAARPPPPPPPPRHGFEMGVSEAARFVESNTLCRSIAADGAVYTLLDEEQRTVAARRRATESGLVLTFREPRPGQRWRRWPAPAAGPGHGGDPGHGGVVAAGGGGAGPRGADVVRVQVALHVDVTEEGYDSTAIRRDPAAFEVCYGPHPDSPAAFPPGRGSEAFGDTVGNPAGEGGSGGGGRSDEKAALGASSLPSASLFAARCYPISRFGGSLEAAAFPVPPPHPPLPLPPLPNHPSSSGSRDAGGGGGEGGNLSVWVWVQPTRRSGGESESGGESGRGAGGGDWMGLTSVTLEPPLGFGGDHRGGTGNGGEKELERTEVRVRGRETGEGGGTRPLEAHARLAALEARVKRLEGALSLAAAAKDSASAAKESASVARPYCEGLVYE